MNTAPSKPPRAPGYWYALVGFGLGSLESVAFNVLAAFIGPAGYSFELWQSLLPALLGAAVWPIALLVSVEVLARVEWDPHWGWWFVRVGGILLVALASAVISYGHIHAVLNFWKYGWLEAGVGPLVIDGQMLISGFALYTIGRAARAALPASQEQAVTPADTPDVPARPDPSSGQEHAVSVTPDTPSLVTEAAPGGQLPRAARPPIRASARPATGPLPRRQAKPPAAGSLSAEDLELVARLRAARDPKTGDLPKVPWMRQEFGIGQSRAARLREAAARTDLHAVKNEEVAVG